MIHMRQVQLLVLFGTSYFIGAKHIWTLKGLIGEKVYSVRMQLVYLHYRSRALGKREEGKVCCFTHA